MTALSHLRLGVNIDHLATIRHARGGAHPDPVKPARIAGAARAVAAPVTETPPGSWCEAVAEGPPAIAAVELQRIAVAARRAKGLGLEVHAGHGLTYATAEAIAVMPEIVELNIGHFLIGEAEFGGLAEAVNTMLAVIDRGSGPAGHLAHVRHTS